MVNYILSFCKITKSSRIFKRHFYLPLLKPLTPKEALRTLRITGKWLLGAKIQHYIPVLLNHKDKRSRKLKDYGQKPHQPIDDYKYLIPVLDLENDTHKFLLDILQSKPEGNYFVYSIEDKKCCLVLDSSFELALRDGQISDILLSQKQEKILIKLNQDKKKILVELQLFQADSQQLLQGEAATTKEQELHHHHGKYTMSLAKIFEDKEAQEEKWELELKKILKKRKVSPKAYRQLVKESIKDLDWKDIELEARKVIEELEQPPETIEEPLGMEVDDLEATRNVAEVLQKAEAVSQLPTFKEISDVIKNMPSASLTSIEVDGRKIQGVRVQLSNGKECFVSGQIVHTEEGEVFIPGQTVEGQYGIEYSPGITVNMSDKPTLITGLILGDQDKEPAFFPTETVITSDGQLTFAIEAEERPKPLSEAERAKIKSYKKTVQEESSESESESEPEPESSESILELDQSDLEELDVEVINIKQEEKETKLDDGMDELIASLEDKKAALKLKLEQLRKLAITSDSLISFAKEQDALELLTSFSSQKAVRLADILLTITRNLANFKNRALVLTKNLETSSLPKSEAGRRFLSCSSKLKTSLKTAVIVANNIYKTRPKDQLLVLKSIKDVLTEDNDLDELLELMNTPLERTEIVAAVLDQLCFEPSEGKMAVLSSLCQEEDLDSVLDKIHKILGNDLGFGKLAKNSSVLDILKDNLKEFRNDGKNDEDAIKILKNCLFLAVRTVVGKNLERMMKSEDFLEEAKAFAQALDVDEAVMELSLVGRDLDLSKLGEASLEALKRMSLIRLLAEKDYSLKNAIARIKKNVEGAKSDSRIRQLVRDSAILLFQGDPVRSSRDIPLKLMKNQNILAIEDFLVQRMKLDHPVLVSRSRFQAVVPKEAARGVLAGRVPYTLIDESGVTTFKPMHMMSAIKTNPTRERRIEDYLNGTQDGVKQVRQHPLHTNTRHNA